MSRTTIIAVWPGEKAEDWQELRNSWGSAPVVWDAMALRYLGKSMGYIMNDMEPLWELWKRHDIPVSHRAVLMLTFDRHYVLRADYARMAADIRDFLTAFPSNGKGANHWPTIAELLEYNPAIPAIGLHCTSVSENPFLGPQNEETGEYGPLDWSTAHNIYAVLGAEP